jgi:hypothetical protein
MAVPDFFNKLRPYKTVLKRTKPPATLPGELLYVHGLAGERKRSLLDASGETHTMTDKVLQSTYKMTNAKTAKTLIEEHWANAKPKQAPKS